jgi:hypothetical protein
VSEHKHTPGPWHNMCSAIGVTSGRDLEAVCLLLDPPEDRFDFERWLADAELIARAPDLLAENERLREAPPPAIVEALEVLLAHDVDYMRRNNLGDPESQQRIKHARAALDAWYGRDDA